MPRVADLGMVKYGYRLAASYIARILKPADLPVQTPTGQTDPSEFVRLGVWTWPGHSRDVC
jgi:hypothetical protein